MLKKQYRVSIEMVGGDHYVFSLSEADTTRLLESFPAEYARFHVEFGPDAGTLIILKNVLRVSYELEEKT